MDLGYLSHVKAMAVGAVRTTFDGQYPVEQFRNVWCSIEYPEQRQNYPGIWIDYDDAKNVQRAGIDHIEIDDQGRPFTRWRFGGHVTFTVVAFTSLERDELYGELVKVIAFGHQNAQTERFRTYVENNGLVACNYDFDQIIPGGSGAAPGTPWGSDEMIYEKSFSLQAQGEFVIDPSDGVLVPLSKILITGRTGGTEDVPVGARTVEIDVNASDDPNYPVGAGEWF